MPLAPGARLGPYEVLALLGAGGMGEVYRARDIRLRRDVAVKVLPESLSQDRDRLRRFEQEALAASELNHPNIITIHDFGSEAGSPYVVFELLEGETLREGLGAGAFLEGKAIEYGHPRVHGSDRSLDAESTRALSATSDLRRLIKIERQALRVSSELAEIGRPNQEASSVRSSAPPRRRPPGK